MVSSNYEFILASTSNNQTETGIQREREGERDLRLKMALVRRRRRHLKTKATFFWLLRWQINKMRAGQTKWRPLGQYTCRRERGRERRGGSWQRLRLLLMQYFAAFAFRAALTIKSFMHAFSNIFSIFSAFAFRVFHIALSAFCRPKKFHALWKLVKLW